MGVKLAGGQVGWVTTYVGGDARENDLLLASGLDSGAEVGVVPGVDLALAVDEGGVGVHLDDLLDQRSVRP